MSQLQIIDANGVALATRALGHGRPLALLHGLAVGSMASWYFPIALPLAEERRVLLYDLRGHGESGTPATGYDLVTQAADLDAVLRYHTGTTEPVDLAGHSLGAAIALQFALANPTRVRRLALVDPPYPIEEHTLGGLRGGESPEALLDEIMARTIREEEREGGRRWVRRHRRLSQLFLETTMIRDLIAERSPTPEALASLRLPVLLVAGRGSNCLAGNRLLNEYIPGSQLVEIDSGHEIPEEAPVELLSVLRDFFSDSGPAR